MKTKFTFLMLAGLFAMGLGSCRTKVGELNVVSTRNVPHDFRALGREGGTDARYIILVFPTRLRDPNLRDAVDDALNDKHGDMLLNAQVHWRWWYLPLIFGLDGYTVKGDIANSHAEPTPKP